MASFSGIIVVKQTILLSANEESSENLALWSSKLRVVVVKIEAEVRAFRRNNLLSMSHMPALAVPGPRELKGGKTLGGTIGSVQRGS